MEVFTAVIRSPPARCYAVFCDIERLPSWVPGLRRARTVRRDGEGRALEVSFEFGQTLTYTLLYTHDPARLRLEWRPGLGGRDAVTGYALFEEHPEGCLVTYAIAPGAARADADLALGHGGKLLAQFANRMERRPPSAFRDWDEAPLEQRIVVARNGARLRLVYHGKVGASHDGYVAELLPDSPAGWPPDEELQALCAEPLFGPGTIEADGERRRRVRIPTD